MKIFLRVSLALLLVVLLEGCATGITSTRRVGDVVSMELPQLLEEFRAGNRFSTETLQLVDSGLDAIGQSDYRQANNYFNQALKLDPTNSWLQFLNGLAYHLAALNGDSSLFELSEQGYTLAAKKSLKSFLRNCLTRCIWINSFHFQAPGFPMETR